MYNSRTSALILSQDSSSSHITSAWPQIPPLLRPVRPVPPWPIPPKEKIHWWPVQQIHGARGPRLHWLSATRHAELMPGDHCCRSLQSPSPLPVLFCLVLCCRSVRGQKSEILSYRSERSSTSIDQRPEDKRTWNGLGWRTRRSHETVDTDRHAIDHLSGQRVYHHHRLTHG